MGEAGETVLAVRDEGPVRILTIDREKRRNALTPGLAEELELALREAGADPRFGAAVLTGVGEHFSSGGDAEAILEVHAQDDEVAALNLLKAFHRLVLEIWESRLPVVAAVSGVAYGGGFNLALVCDLVVCSADARFCQVFLRRGVIPDVGGGFLLPRLVGMQRAKELMLLCPEISADKALELGIANEVRPDPATALERAVEIATEIAGRPRHTVALTKRLTNSSVGDFRASLELEGVSQASVLLGPAAKAGLDAFLAKKG